MNRDSSNFNSRIVVSGVGIVSPLGTGREATWKSLLAGESGIAATRNGLEARVLNFSLNGARSRMGDFALLAAEEALRHAGFDPRDLSDKRIGCAISQSKPVVEPTPQQDMFLSPPGGRVGEGPSPRALNPSPAPSPRGEGNKVLWGLDPTLLLASFFGWSAESVVRREFNLNGPSSNIVAACATGVASIDIGASWIRSGLCDAVLVGASESSLNSFYRSGFEQMGVLAHGSSTNVCPFDKNRGGFAIGEGAAVLVLESEASVQMRGHKPLAAFLKTSLQHSSTDSVRFDSDGSAVARLLKSVLDRNDSVDYINAHGTATQLNDVVETRGIKLALQEKSAKVKISSTKAATGHLLGAAGAIEAAFCVLALRDQRVPPTLHLSHPDPECDLDYVPEKSEAASLTTAVSLSYGFGGQMGAVAFGRLS